jgi:hypothetical protein
MKSLLRDLEEERGQKSAPSWVTKVWVRDPGPRSSRRWRNTDSGQVVYADSQPAGAGGDAAGGPAAQAGQTTATAAGGGEVQEATQGRGAASGGLPAHGPGHAGPATQLLEEVWAGLRAEQKLLNAGASPAKLPEGYTERAEVLRKEAHALYQRILGEAKWKLGEGEGLEAIRHHQDVMLRHYLAGMLDHREAEQKRTSPTGDVAEVAKGWGPHQFASTQFNLPVALAARVTNFALTIPEEELAESGIESESHITSRYGLHTEDGDEVRRLVENFGPIEATLGNVEVFPAEDDHGFDVVYIAVDSPDLHALHEILGQLPNTDKFPRYVPHVCAAYLASGEGAKYAGDNTLAGETVTLTELIFSAKDGTRTVIDLGAAPQPDHIEKGKDDLRRVALRRIGARLRAHKAPAPMPGYGKIFLLGDHVWYVGGDGDEDGFSKIVETKLGSVPGVTQVTYESEAFPPRSEGWKQVYPPEEGGWRDKLP